MKVCSFKKSEYVSRGCSSGTAGKSNLPTWDPKNKRQKELKNLTAKKITGVTWRYGPQ